MNTDKWIENIISKCQVEKEPEVEYELVDLLVRKSFEESKHGIDIGLLLAASFDLLISAEYYGSLSHSGWLYCPGEEPRLFFHYTSVCPRHVLQNRFFFHQSNKPTSGKIGTATTKLLLLMLKSIFRLIGHEEEILRGTEPVDAIIVNREAKRVLFAEIKASPLLTLPLSMITQALTQEVDGEIKDVPHTTIVNQNLYDSNIELLVPRKVEDNWIEQYYILGQRHDAKDELWGYRGILELIRNNEAFFRDYLAFWTEAFNSYGPRLNKDIFWLTNGCGTPSPIPEGWQKRRVGTGYESVSDSKTSVGMDRTDDIKKGIYQVLKLGAEGKPTTKSWEYKVGIISNIHPARHFDYYLQPLVDIVWTNDISGRAKVIGDLPQDHHLYNLFDGLITFTKLYSRDEWIDHLFMKFTSR